MTQTIMTNEEYVAHNGTVCPFCESQELDTSCVEFDAPTINDSVICQDCLAEWVDTYQMTSITKAGNATDDAEYSEDVVARYRESLGLECPHCDSASVELSPDSIDGEGGVKEVETSCLDCKAEWKEVYTLIGMPEGTMECHGIAP